MNSYSHDDSKDDRYHKALEVLKERGGYLSTRDLKHVLGMGDNHVIVLRRRLKHYQALGKVINIGKTSDGTEGWCYNPHFTEPPLSPVYLAHGGAQAVCAFINREFKRTDNALPKDVQGKLFKVMVEALQTLPLPTHKPGAIK